MVSAPARRRQVEFARRRGLSNRRACWLLCVARSSLGYESRNAEADAPVLERMRQLASMYPRYGYRRIRIFLGWEGHRMSVDRTPLNWTLLSRARQPRPFESLMAERRGSDKSLWGRCRRRLLPDMSHDSRRVTSSGQSQGASPSLRPHPHCPYLHVHASRDIHVASNRANYRVQEVGGLVTS